jgi:hypothetical protein
MCVNGSCVCDNGFMLCNGNCVDTQNDASNCGSCGKVCPVLSSPSYGAICSAGTCTGYVGGYVAAGSGPANSNPDGQTVYAVQATMPNVSGNFAGIGGVVGSNDAVGDTTQMIYALYSDSGGKPSSLYFNTNPSDTSMAFQDPSALHTLTSASGVYSNGFNNVLAASTTYWVYMKAGTNGRTGEIAGLSSSPCYGGSWINVAPPGTFPSTTTSCPGDFNLYLIVTFP